MLCTQAMLNPSCLTLITIAEPWGAAFEQRVLVGDNREYPISWNEGKQFM
jgi:hypothetical protein